MIVVRKHSSPVRCARAGEHGFTLIELLVTVTVLAVLLGVGVPSFTGFIAGQKVKTASYDLTTALMLARSEAIKRNTDITIAPETAGAWVSGWTVKAGATTLLQQQALSGVTITTALPTVVYKPTGRPDLASAGNFEINGSSSVKCLKVDSSGIPSTKTVACP